MYFKLLFILFCSTLIFSQNNDPISTASSYLKDVSDVYANIQDYTANIVIYRRKTEWEGQLSFKKPNLFRIDFSNPSGQVIVVDDKEVNVHLPGSRMVFSQGLDANRGLSIATNEGLNLLRRFYSVSYLNSPAPEEIKSGGKKYIRLSLIRRTTDEIFSKLNLGIDPKTNLIEHIEGTTINGEVFTFELVNISVNKGIDSNRFIYNSPGTARKVENFLYSN